MKGLIMKQSKIKETIALIKLLEMTEKENPNAKDIKNTFDKLRKELVKLKQRESLCH
jgi:hypothetical protein